MKKIILSLLLLLFPFCKTTASTKITIEPVSNTIVDKIAASGYFSFKSTQDGEDKTLEASDFEVLKLGSATFSECAVDNSNWKCKVSVELSYGEHILTTVTADSKIKTLPFEIPEAKKVVVITYAIVVSSKNSKVTSKIAANSDIEIVLTANVLTTGTATGQELSNYFKLGSITLGTCSETGLANGAAIGTTATIKCKNSAEIPEASTAYELQLQDTKNSVNSMSIGTSGNVLVSSNNSDNNDNKSNSGNYLVSSLLFIFIFLV